MAAPQAQLPAPAAKLQNTISGGLSPCPDDSQTSLWSIGTAAWIPMC